MKRLLVLVICVSVSSTAYATFINFRTLNIGFGPSGMSSVTISIGEGIDLIITARDFSGNSQELFFNSEPGEPRHRRDGLGISTGGYEPDEIEYPEVLVLEFSRSINVLSLTLTSFFAHERGHIPSGGQGLGRSPFFDEMGWWSTELFNPDTDILGVDFFEFTATDPHLDSGRPGRRLGIFQLPLGGIETTTLFLSAPGLVIMGERGPRQHHEFALGGLRFEVAQVVPEPASILLLGGPLLMGLAALCRAGGKED